MTREERKNRAWRFYEESLNELKEEITMTHEEKMDRAWRFIENVGITEDRAAFEKDPDNVILVDDIYKVRDAYYDDLENGVNDENEDVYGFLDRHGIEWK